MKTKKKLDSTTILSLLSGLALSFVCSPEGKAIMERDRILDKRKEKRALNKHKKKFKIGSIVKNKYGRKGGNSGILVKLLKKETNCLILWKGNSTLIAENIMSLIVVGFNKNICQELEIKKEKDKKKILKLSNTIN